MKIYHVTEVLGKYVDFTRIPDQIMYEACQRGKLVHSAAAALALGTWHKPLPDLYEGYFQSFKRWYHHHVEEAILVEHRLTDSVLGYTGQLDLLALLINGQFALVDLKTPITESKTWKVQLATYKHLAEEEGHRVDYGLVVQPKASGAEAKAIPYMPDSMAAVGDFSVFLCALTAHRNLT